MERVVVVGNCQALALEMMLATNDEFVKRFEFASFPAVHEITAEMVPELHSAVADAAVVIPQRVDEAYRDGIGLGTETLARIARTEAVVRWPSVHWAGYHPDLFYLRDAAGRPVVDGPFDYHDRVVLQAYAAGFDVSDTCQLMEDPDRPSDASTWAAKATAELEIRGRDCDVQVASFIEAGFRDELLFFTMNHPANRVLAHMARQVTELMGVPGGIDDRRIPNEMLGSTLYPLHANHVRELQLGFGVEFGAGHAPFRIRGTTYEPSEAVRMFFDYYAAHPELVAPNCSPAGTGSSPSH